MPPKKSLGREIYSDTADFGKFYAKWSFYISVVLAILLSVGGVYLFFQKDDATAIAHGTVQQSTYNQAMRNYLLIVDVNHPFTCAGVMVDSQKPYAVGDKISLFFNPNAQNQCSTIEAQRTPYRMIGGFMVLFAVLMLSVSYFTYYLTRKSKMGAAAVGAGGIFNLLGFGGR